jgi:[ribosomal protein S5]-alanine N-acetyltransferase
MSSGPELARSERLALRDIQLGDVAHYHRWMNDPVVTRYLESRFRPWSLQLIKGYIERHTKDPNSARLLAIILLEDGRHIGNIKLGPIDWVHRTAGVGLLIGESDCWGKGYGSEAISLAARFAFRQLDLRKLVAGIYSSNVGSVRAFTNAGFVEEGRQREQWLDCGAYVDGILMGLLQKEWESRC